MDIEKLLAGIEALRQFQSEPTPAATTAAERVRIHLIERYGPPWMLSQIASYELPDETIHVAVIAFRRGISMRIVAESASGTLLEGQGIESDDGDSQSSKESAMSVSADQECLSEIIPALIEASKIVKAADIKKSLKKQIREQIAHAVKHLMAKVAKGN